MDKSVRRYFRVIFIRSHDGCFASVSTKNGKLLFRMAHFATIECGPINMIFILSVQERPLKQLRIAIPDYVLRLSENDMFAIDTSDIHEWQTCNETYNFLHQINPNSTKVSFSWVFFFFFFSLNFHFFFVVRSNAFCHVNAMHNFWPSAKYNFVSHVENALAEILDRFHALLTTSKLWSQIGKIVKPIRARIFLVFFFLLFICAQKIFERIRIGHLNVRQR